MGFTTKGANTNMQHTPQKRVAEGPRLERDSRYPNMVQNGLSGGGGSNSAPPMKRHFEFERKEYPWTPHSGYQPVSNTVRVASWGRQYTNHAIDRTLPSGARHNHNGIGDYNAPTGRSIPPLYVERTIAYGMEQTDKYGRKNYTSGDLTVGVSKDEKTVHHVRYEHKKK